MTSSRRPRHWRSWRVCPQAAELVASAQDALIVLKPARDDAGQVDPIEVDQRFGVTRAPGSGTEAGSAAAADA